MHSCICSEKSWILSARNTIVSFLCVWFRVKHLHFVNILLKHSLQLFFIFLPVQQGVCLKLFMATIQRYNKKCWKSKEQEAVSSWEKKLRIYSRFSCNCFVLLKLFYLKFLLKFKTYSLLIFFVKAPFYFMKNRIYYNIHIFYMLFSVLNNRIVKRSEIFVRQIL